MSAQLFLNVEQILDLIKDELPAGVYPDDRADDPNPNNRSYSSSELRAHAMMFAQLYSNLQNVYSDIFISTVTEAGLTYWENELFSAAQDSNLSYTTRQQNLLAKLRAIGGISYPAIYSVIQGILGPVGLTFDLLPYSGQNYNGVPTAWVLDYSPLGESTWISSLDPIIGERMDSGYTPLDCNLDYAAAGLTQQQLIEIQSTAYEYEVRIYGNADASTLALLDSQLTKLEPARSTHNIVNNAVNTLDSSISGWSTEYLLWYKS